MSRATFGNWEPEIHFSSDQQTRMKSASKADLTPVFLDPEMQSGHFSGRHGQYETTLTTCECGDFKRRRLPCKHIYRLAHELCGFDLKSPVVTDQASIVSPDVYIEEELFSSIENLINEQPYDSYVPMLFLLDFIRNTDARFRTKTISHAKDYISDKLNRP